MEDPTGTIAAVHRSPGHTFSKQPHDEIRLIAGEGVEGDAHRGETVKHRSRVAADPTQPNLRQVHLVPSELQATLRSEGFPVDPGAMGENITTEGIDLNPLPVGTRLRLGPEAEIELTGLRNPCGQLNGLAPGLMKRLVYNENGTTIRLGGVMSVVITGGVVRPGDPIHVTLPPEPHVAMERV